MGDTLGETLHSVQQDDPVSPRVLRPNLPKDLETICLKCLEKEPARRYQSALQVVQDLDRWQNHEPIQARRITCLKRVEKWIRRRPAVAVLSAAFILALVLGLSGIVWQWQQAEQERVEKERENYAASLQLAQQHLQEGNIQRARELLLKQPEHLRHIEWGRLIAESFPPQVSVSPATAREMRDVLYENFHARVACNGKHFATWGGNVAQLWDQSGKELHRWGQTNTPAGPCEFSPDGSRFLLIGPTRAYSMWDTQNNTLLFEAPAAEARPYTIGFSPNGTIFYAAYGTYAELRNAQTGRLLHRLEKVGQPINALHFSRNGERIWNLRHEKHAGQTQSIWDVQTGALVVSLPFQPETYLHSQISADGNLYAAVTLNGVAEVWSINGSVRDFSTPESSGPYGSATVTSNGTRLVVGLANKSEFDLWDLPNRKLLRTSGARASQWQLTPDEQSLLSGGTERFIRIWDLASGEPMHQLNTGQAGAGTLMHVSDDSRYVAIIGRDGTVSINPLNSTDTKLRYHAWPNTAVFAPNRHQLIATYPHGKMLLWDYLSHTAVHLHGHRQWVSSAEFSSDGTRIYSISADRTVRLWDAKSGELIKVATNHTRPALQLMLSGDGSTLVSGDTGSQFWVWASQTLEPKCMIQAPKGKDGMFAALHPDGSELLVPSPAGMIAYDTSSGHEQWRAPIPDFSTIVFIAYAPNGDRFVVGTDHGWLELWQRSPLMKLAHTRGRGLFAQMTFSSDSQRLLVVSDDSNNSSVGRTSIDVYDPKTLKLLVSLSPVVGTGYGLCLSADNRRIARTRIDDSHLSTPLEVFDVFPWKAADYGGATDTNLSSRIATYATQHWKEKLQQSVTHSTQLPIETWKPPAEEWPKRDINTPKQCVDLTPWYNRWLDSCPINVTIWNSVENHLGNVPRGLVRFDNVPYDVRGVITGRAQKFWVRKFEPPDTLGIRVGMKCQRLHFLHCTSSSDRGKPVVARYRLYYANGTTHDLEVKREWDIFDWWGSPGELSPPEAPAKIVWRGRNYATDQQNSELRLSARTWTNPYPNVEITSFDFISQDTPVSPLLIALTLE